MLSFLHPQHAQPITEELFADLLDESEVVQSIDTGPSLSHSCIHPQRGDIILVSQFKGPFELVTLH